MTEWTIKLILIAPNAAATVQNANIFADIIAAESGESVANERKLMDNAVRLATNANQLVQVGRGIVLPVKASMRSALVSAINTINAPLSNANKIKWYAIASVDLPNFQRGDLVDSNRSQVADRIGTRFGLADVLEDLGIVRMAESAD